MGTLFSLFRFDLESEKQTSDKMQLNFRGISSSYALNLEDDERDVSLMEVASAVAEREGAPEVLLYVNGHPLDLEMTAGDLENCTVDVSVPLKGGKVHGSLARAGKVRGQTPKVEAQEKKKKKTGRAKRRIQYIRRFVNVVETFGGRKKGPNSNSE